jgi:hypothetical protein
MTVPLWASLASIAVAFIPPLQNWLQNSAQPLSGAISSAGNCSIPLTLVVLGAYFYPEVPESSNNVLNPPMLTINPSTSTLVEELTVESSSSSRKATARKGETMTVIISIMSRMILTPLTLMPLIVFAAKYDFHAVLEEYVCLFSIKPYIPVLTTRLKQSRLRRYQCFVISFTTCSYVGANHSSCIWGCFRTTYIPHYFLVVLCCYTADDYFVCVAWSCPFEDLEFVSCLLFFFLFDLLFFGFVVIVWVYVM